MQYICSKRGDEGSIYAASTIIPTSFNVFYSLVFRGSIGVIPKNENVPEEMVHLMDDLHMYAPTATQGKLITTKML